MESVDGIKYGLVEAKVVGTPSILSIKAVINVVGIMVSGLLVLLVLPMCPKKRMWIPFDGCSIPLYECLLKRI